MSRGNNWVGIDKNLTQEFKHIRREFSRIEAMFSYTIDQDNGVELPISGYSRIWSWSRCKVRKFIKEIKTDEGHIKDRKQTDKRHPIHFIDKTLWSKQDDKKTGKRHKKDRLKTPTSNPNPNNPNNKEKSTKKEDPLLTHLFLKIEELKLQHYKDRIIEFYKYRMAKPKAKQYKTEQGINILFKDILGCQQKELDITECLEEAIGRDWLTPKPGYFKTDMLQRQNSNRSQQNAQACLDFINENNDNE